MERKVSEARRRFIANESNEWVTRGIITDEQRSGILDTYASGGRFSSVIVVLGILMIGIGVLTFVAANWQWLVNLPGWFRIAFVDCVYIASAGAAYFFERRGRSLSSAILLFLSGFLLMGAMAVTGQVFHSGASLETFLLVWLAVYAPTWIFTKDIPIFIFFEAVSLAYLNLIFFNYGSVFYRIWNYSHDEPRGLVLGPIIPALLVAAITAVAWHTWYGCVKQGHADPESKLKYFFVGGSTRRIFLSNLAFLNWFIWICMFNSGHESLLPFFAAILVIGLIIDIMGWKMRAPDLEIQGLVCVAVSGFALTFPFVWDNGGYRRYDYDYYNSINPVVASSVIFAAYLVWRIIRGRRGSGFAVFLFCALAARWYFDTFYTFMSRSMFFISGGFILLAIAFAYYKWHKYTKAAGAEAASKEQTADETIGGTDDDDR